MVVSGCILFFIVVCFVESGGVSVFSCFFFLGFIFLYVIL